MTYSNVPVRIQRAACGTLYDVSCLYNIETFSLNSQSYNKAKYFNLSVIVFLNISNLGTETLNIVLF